MLSRIRNVTIGESEPITKCNKSALCGWCGYMLLCEDKQNDMNMKVDFELL